MPDDYRKVGIGTRYPEDECVRVWQVPFGMVKGDVLRQETADYSLKGLPPSSSDRTEAIKLLSKRGLKVCDEVKDDFMRKGFPLQLIVVPACQAKVKIHWKVTIQEIAAFLVPEPSHRWQAGEGTDVWDMEAEDIHFVPVDALPPSFGTLGPIKLTHDKSTINYNGKWTGPRSGVTFEGGYDKSCPAFVAATPEAPYGATFFFSSPYGDCTFDEDCSGVRPPQPLSDNFNNLPWKAFWDFRTYSPAASFPIGSWIVEVLVESRGPVES